jgi:hypothetical protein
MTPNGCEPSYHSGEQNEEEQEVEAGISSRRVEGWLFDGTGERP